MGVGEMKPNMKLPWRFVPWHIEEDSSAVRSPEGWIVCTTSSDADAKFIALACNSHAELVEALERCEAMVSTDQGPPNWDWVRGVLKKARGETP
jgi:hypothetical protein